MVDPEEVARLLDQGDALLTTAGRIVRGETALPVRCRIRAAALFARSALERLIEARLERHGFTVSEASWRVKLLVLSTVPAVPDVGDLRQAWAGLSGACHQHAYELSPTAEEVAHLVELVRQCRQRFGHATEGAP